ncbi:hypothetical protein CF328_g9435, partial [Tilletia controversa]
FGPPPVVKKAAYSAGPSRQLGAAQDRDLPASSRQAVTAAPVRSLSKQKPTATTTKPKVRVRKAKPTKPSKRGAFLESPTFFPSKLVVYQDSPEAGGPPRQHHTTGAVEDLVHEDSLGFGPPRTANTTGPVDPVPHEDSLGFGPPRAAKQNVVAKPTIRQNRPVAGPSQQPKIAMPAKPSKFEDSLCESPGASPCVMRTRLDKGKERRISGMVTPPLAFCSDGEEGATSINQSTKKDDRTIVKWSVRTPPLTPPRRACTTRHSAQQIAAPFVTPPPRLRPTIAPAAAIPTQQAGEEATLRAATAAVAPVRRPLGVREVPEPESEPETEELADEPSVSRVEPVREERAPIIEVARVKAWNIEVTRVKTWNGLYQIQVCRGREGPAPEPLPPVCKPCKRVKLPPLYISSRTVR